MIYDLILCEVPQGFVFLGCAVFVTPPEPEAVVLVPRTEDKRNRLTVIIGKRQKERTYALKPGHEQVMGRSWRQDSGYHAIGSVPCCTAGNRVTRMPADGDDTATTMMCTNRFANAVERYTVEVLGVAHLDAAEVKAHDGRPVTAGLEHITASDFVFPTDSVERVVLVTKHRTLLPE